MIAKRGLSTLFGLPASRITGLDGVVAQYRRAVGDIEAHRRLVEEAMLPTYKPPEVGDYTMSDVAQPGFEQQFARDLSFRGPGVVFIRGFFDPEHIRACRQDLNRIIASQGAVTTHFQDAQETQARAWNLPFKSEPFLRLLAHPDSKRLMDALLGSDHHLGSLAGNIIRPTNQGQSVHQDFPRWRSFALEKYAYGYLTNALPTCQWGIPLDDFTETNGATELLPGSHLLSSHPPAMAKDIRSFDGAVKAVAECGDVLLFNGAVWHRAGANESEADRASALVQMLPGPLKPMEDSRARMGEFLRCWADVTPEGPVREYGKQLIGLHYVYPVDLDTVDPSNSEGIATDAQRV